MKYNNMMADHNLKKSLSLIMYFITFVIVSAKTFRISTDSTSCKNETSNDMECTTLSQFALNSTSYSMSSDNITLNMDPGTHVLNATIFLSNFPSIALYGPPSLYINSTIICNTTSPAVVEAMVIENISKRAVLAGVKFEGCGTISITSVKDFFVGGCNFSGNGLESVGMILSDTNARFELDTEFTMYSGGALSIINDSELLIYDSSFHDNQVANWSDEVLEFRQLNFEDDSSIFNQLAMQQRKMFGGAIRVYNSKVFIANTKISNNAALLGGAIYIENGHLEMGSSMMDNFAYSGGAIFANRGNLTLNRLVAFTSNSALYGGNGGAVSLRMSTASIEDVKFRSNTAVRGGCFYVHSSELTVSDVEFHGNTAVHGGCFDIHSFTELNISDSRFSSNIADYGAVIEIATQSSVTIEKSTLAGNNASIYGGGVYALQQSTVTIDNSTLNNCTASYGGGIYSETFATIIITESSLLDNRVTRGGAAVYLNQTNFQFINSKISRNLFSGRLGFGFAFESQLLITGESIFSENCGSLVSILSNVTFDGDSIVFKLNNAPNICALDDSSVLFQGGAVSAHLGDIIFTGKVNFTSNEANYGGAIIGWEAKIHIWGEVTFVNNMATVGGGGIYIYESMLEFAGARCTFDSNEAMDGGGIDVVSSTITVFNNSEIAFVRNSAQKGGGIFFELGSKLSIVKTNPFDKINVIFSDNTANKGGAIFVDDYTYSGTCAASSIEPTLQNFHAASECFFQIFAIYQSANVPKVLTKHINFNNNLAVTGNSLYGGLLDRCVPNPFTEFATLYVNETVTGTDYAFNTTNIKGEDVASKPVRLCFCQNGEPNCDFVPTGPWIVVRGVTESLPIVAVDQVNHTVSASVVGYLFERESRLGFSERDQKTSGGCSDLKYSIHTVLENEQMALFAKGPCKNIGISGLVVNITFTECNCPIGFRVVNTSDVCMCECVNELQELLGGRDRCNIDNDNSLVRDSKFWIGAVDDVPNRDECLAVFRYCPFDYCYTPSLPFTSLNLNISTLNNSDVQCDNNRTGVLCGACRNDFSLAFGTSRCIPNSECTNSYLSLLIVFALAGIALVAFIMFFNLTVAVGTINGLIFYANIIVTNRNNISQFISVNPITIFIAWLNLDLGIETCFHQGMNELSKVGWQFAFPLYVLFLVALVIFLSEYSQRFANFLSGRNPVATLDTLILLSYVKFLRIIIDIFSPAKLNYICPNGSMHEKRWFYDGTINYFDSRHVLLLLAATVVLLFGTAYTLILLTAQWFTCIPYRRGFKWLSGNKLNHFLEPYFAPYIPKHRYWTGLLLVARLLNSVTGTLSTNNGLPEGNLFVMTMLGATLLLWKLVVGGRIYRYWLLDILESIFLLFLIVYGNVELFIFAYVNTLEPVAFYYTLGSFVLVIFVMILLYHSYKYVLLSTHYGKKFHKWIAMKIRDNKESLRNTGYWNKPNENLQHKNRFLTRGVSLFSQPGSLSNQRRPKLPIKKKSQPVTYTMINTPVEEIPLSEQLGHYKHTKERETGQCSKRRRFQGGQDQLLYDLEEISETSVCDNESTMSETSSTEHTNERNGTNSQYTCVNTKKQSRDESMTESYDMNKVTANDKDEPVEIVVECETEELNVSEHEILESMPPVVPNGENTKGEEFATSYTLLRKD